MGKKCCVFKCTNTSYQKQTGLTFHKFPSNRALRQVWFRQLKNAVGSSEYSRSGVLCSEHFEKHLFVNVSSGRCRLQYDAIPTIFPKKNNIVQNNNKDERGEITCRTCLQKCTNRKLYYIFNPWSVPWNGMEQTMAQDLIKATRIVVDPREKFSNMICEICVVRLRDTCDFINTVQKNDELLRNVALNGEFNGTWPKPIPIDSSFGGPVKIKEEIISEDEETETPQWSEEYRHDIEIKVEPEELIGAPENEHSLSGVLLTNACSIAEQTTPMGNGYHSESEKASAEIKIEPPDEDSSSELSLECILCSKVFKTLSGLKAHVIAEHSYKSVKRKSANSMSPESEKVRQFTCGTCSEDFLTSTDLMVHESCHNKSVCFSCNAKFDTFEQLTRHTNNECNEIKMYTNELQVAKQWSNDVQKDVTMDDVSRLPNNSPETEVKGHKCDMCDETFTEQYYLRIHEEILHNTGDFEVLDEFSESTSLTD